MDELIQKIVTNKIPCYFISPHLDDAALSAGSLLSKLSKNTQVTLINVFTQGRDTKNSLSAKKHLRITGSASASQIFKLRRHEDLEAMTSLGVKVQNLNYIDALWRLLDKPNRVQKILGALLPDFIHKYPVYRWHVISGRVVFSDNELIESIGLRLKKYIPKNAVVFCPLGVGGHVDHLVVRYAVEKFCSPIYWLDQPYFSKTQTISKLLTENLTKISFPINHIQKQKLLNFYKTQINDLYPMGKIPHTNEIYYIPRTPIYNSPKLPSKILDYKLISQEQLEKNTPEIFYGKYINPEGKYAFAKVWSGNRKNINYYLLRNEISIYRNIWSKIKIPKNIRIPKLIYSENSSQRLYLLLEFITGDHLLKQTVNKKIAVYNQILAFFSQVTPEIKKKGLKFAFNRPNLYWMLIMPIVSCRAIFKHPEYLSLILFGSVEFYKHSLSQFIYQKTGFVHRDLGDWNVIINKKQIWVYDYQLSTLADPILDRVIVLLKSWSDLVFCKKMIKTKSYQNILTNSVSKARFKALSICFAIYDIAQCDTENSRLAKSYLQFSINL